MCSRLNVLSLKKRNTNKNIYNCLGAYMSTCLYRLIIKSAQLQYCDFIKWKFVFCSFYSYYQRLVHTDIGLLIVIYLSEIMGEELWVGSYPIDSHYNDIILSAMASQITSLTIVHSSVYSGADQRKHQSSASLAFVWGIHRGPVNSPHKGPVTRNMFPFDDVIMGQIQWTSHAWNSVADC